MELLIELPIPEDIWHIILNILYTTTYRCSDISMIRLLNHAGRYAVDTFYKKQTQLVAVRTSYAISKYFPKLTNLWLLSTGNIYVIEELPHLQYLQIYDIPKLSRGSVFTDKTLTLVLESIICPCCIFGYNYDKHNLSNTYQLCESCAD
jgi:hypothetical protein